MKFINTRIEDELFEKARALADSERRSVSSWVRNPIQDAVDTATAPRILPIGRLRLAVREGDIIDGWPHLTGDSGDIRFRGIHLTAGEAMEPGTAIGVSKVDGKAHPVTFATANA